MTFQILDLYGRVLSLNTMLKGTYNYPVNTERLASGSYFIRFYSSDIFVTLRNGAGTLSTQIKYVHQADPNPVNSILYINGIEKGSHIIITDIMGKEIFKKLTDNSILQYDLSNISPGIYIVQVNEMIFKKIIKQ